MPFLTSAQRALLQGVSRLGYANPFLPERVELERAVLGTEFMEGEPVWSYRAEHPEPRANVWRIVSRLEPLVEHLAASLRGGMSAGGVCWFEGFTTDSFGPELRPVRDGLGVLRGSFIPHYHGEEQRRPLYHRLVADGTLSGGYGVDDGAALVFRGTEMSEVVSSQDGAVAYRVERVDGAARETRLPTRYLGD